MPVATPPVVYVVTEARHYVHASIPAARDAVVARLRADGAQPVVLARARSLTPARIAAARGVVFVDTDGSPPLAPGAKQALVARVRTGGGVVALHAASNAFRAWAGWGELLGARFVRHPPIRTDTVALTGDAVVRGLRPRRVRLRDEFYVVDRDPRRSGARVLARLGSADHRPLAWRRADGSGRVVYDALGHSASAWRASDWRLGLVDAGLRWALRLTPGAR